MPNAAPQPPRLAAFRYLNSIPLLAGLDADQVPVRWGTPAECARILSDCHAEVALIPSIEYARGDGYRFVPEIAISTERSVRSVVVLARVPIEECESIALDASSRTSVALLRILLARRFRVRPRLEVQPPDIDRMLARHDAALLIADAALVAPSRSLRVYDLAEEWHDMTGLPFVFALWAVRAGVELDPGWVLRLQRSLRMGVQDLAGIARREAPRLGLDEDLALAYLSENLRYGLGPRERQALSHFFTLAAEEDLAPANVQLRAVAPPAQQDALAARVRR